MRILVALGEPGCRVRNVDAEFFMEFALECLQGTLARLELAPRKLPIAGIRGTRKPLRQEYRTVAPEDHCHRDAYERRGVHAFLPALSARAPA